MLFLDETHFIAYPKTKPVYLVGAIEIDPEKLTEEERKLRRDIGITDDAEPKWNLDLEEQMKMGREKYEKYKDEFASLMCGNMVGYFAVSQLSKNDATMLLLKPKIFPTKSILMFDDDLIEKADPTQLQMALKKYKWSEGNSKNSVGLLAADYYVGLVKLVVQQNAPLRSKSLLKRVPDYVPQPISAEFVARMQVRWLMPGKTKLGDLNQPVCNCIGHSVFLSKNLDSGVRKQFADIYSDIYLGCTH